MNWVKITNMSNHGQGVTDRFIFRLTLIFVSIILFLGGLFLTV